MYLYITLNKYWKYVLIGIYVLWIEFKNNTRRHFWDIDLTDITKNIVKYNLDIGIY